MCCSRCTDVGLQEVAPGEQRLHLALDLHPLLLAGLARLDLGRLDDRLTLGLGVATVDLSLTFSVGDGGVGGALGEQQRAADRLGLGDRRDRRRDRIDRRRRLGVGRTGRLQLLHLGHRGSGPGFHRRGLLQRRLERRRHARLEGVDLGGVVAVALDRLEPGRADVLRGDGHVIGQLS